MALSTEQLKFLSVCIVQFHSCYVYLVLVPSFGVLNTNSGINGCSVTEAGFPFALSSKIPGWIRQAVLLNPCLRGRNFSLIAPTGMFSVCVSGIMGAEINGTVRWLAFGVE